MCASSARATRQPSATSSSRTSVSAAGAFAVMRIETNGRFVVGAADAELEHVERRVVPDDGVHHRVQQLRVDEVAFGFDHLSQGGVRYGFISLLLIWRSKPSGSFTW